MNGSVYDKKSIFKVGCDNHATQYKQLYNFMKEPENTNQTGGGQVPLNQSWLSFRNQDNWVIVWCDW